MWSGDRCSYVPTFTLMRDLGSFEVLTHPPCHEDELSEISKENHAKCQISLTQFY